MRCYGPSNLRRGAARREGGGGGGAQGGNADMAGILERMRHDGVSNMALPPSLLHPATGPPGARLLRCDAAAAATAASAGTLNSKPL